MKIVKILGGIGNQMFQYAFLLALKAKYNEEFLIDTSIFDTWKIHNGYELENVFGIKEKRATPADIRRVSWYFKKYELRRSVSLYFPKRTACLEKSPYHFYPEFQNVEGDAYYDGYWQYYKYFETVKDVVLSAFQFAPDTNTRNIDLIRDMSNQDFISIHVRRGDYLESPEYAGICDIDYYKEAIRVVTEKIAAPTFLIFSNDINWCKQHISPLLNGHPTTFVDWNVGKTSFRDMELMSMCKANIIANSSFSWWAAYLKKTADKLVVAPRKWTNRKMEFAVQPDDWYLI